MVYGAIEAGGTKFVVAIGKESGKSLNAKATQQQNQQKQ